MTGWAQHDDIEDWERDMNSGHYEGQSPWPLGAFVILFTGLGMLALAVLLDVFG